MLKNIASYWFTIKFFNLFCLTSTLNWTMDVIKISGYIFNNKIILLMSKILRYKD